MHAALHSQGEIDLCCTEQGTDEFVVLNSSAFCFLVIEFLVSIFMLIGQVWHAQAACQ